MKHMILTRLLYVISIKDNELDILLADNGFEYYKLSDNLFDTCAEGRLLILSPWQYDAGKHHISRADCQALNAMAEEIIAWGNTIS